MYVNSLTVGTERKTPTVIPTPRRPPPTPFLYSCAAVSAVDGVLQRHGVILRQHIQETSSTCRDSVFSRVDTKLDFTENRESHEIFMFFPPLVSSKCVLFPVSICKMLVSHATEGLHIRDILARMLPLTAAVTGTDGTVYSRITVKFLQEMPEVFTEKCNEAIVFKYLRKRVFCLNSILKKAQVYQRFSLDSHQSSLCHFQLCLAFSLNSLNKKPSLVIQLTDHGVSR